MSLICTLISSYTKLGIIARMLQSTSSVMASILQRITKKDHITAPAAHYGPRILLGCTGSVATIKIPIIAKRLQQFGASVIVLPTRQSLHFLKVLSASDSSSVNNVQNDLPSDKSSTNIAERHNVVNKSKMENKNKENFKYACDQSQNSEPVISSRLNHLYCYSCSLYSRSQSAESSGGCESGQSSCTTPEARVTNRCEWCEVQRLYPELKIAGDTLEWESWKGRGDPVLHIELRRWADILLIAPLSANSLAKIASGLCDNLLTCVIRAWDVNKPLFFCPAMNTLMYEHPMTAKQIATLKVSNTIALLFNYAS